MDGDDLLHWYSIKSKSEEGAVGCLLEIMSIYNMEIHGERERIKTAKLN